MQQRFKLNSSSWLPSCSDPKVIVQKLTLEVEIQACCLSIGCLLASTGVSSIWHYVMCVLIGAGCRYKLVDAIKASWSIHLRPESLFWKVSVTTRELITSPGVHCYTNFIQLMSHKLKVWSAWLKFTAVSLEYTNATVFFIFSKTELLIDQNNWPSRPGL